jgi:hypothetical protein
VVLAALSLTADRTGSAVPFPRDPCGASRLATHTYRDYGEDPIMVLTLRDLMPDAAGEVASQNIGLPAVSIYASQQVAITRAGTVEQHVTAAGEDVSGYRFYSFDNGMTVYFPPDVVVLIERTAP